MTPHYQEYTISQALSPFVECVWTESFTQRPNQIGKRHIVVPDNSVEWVITSGSIKRKQIGKSNWKEMQSHIAGLKTRPQELIIHGQPLLSIRFKPYGLAFFTQFEMSKLVDGNVDTCEIFGNEGLEFQRGLIDIKRDSDRVQAITTFLMHRLDFNQADLDLLRESIALLCKTHGKLSVAKLGEWFGVSQKTIHRKFIKYIGVGPKKFGRLVRFVHCQSLKQEISNLDTQSKVYDFGFTDQAHFIKEVKYFTGMTPEQFGKASRALQVPIFSS